MTVQLPRLTRNGTHDALLLLGYLVVIGGVFWAGVMVEVHRTAILSIIGIQV